ncbi:MAG: SH3 domain-containing protein [Lachnospiraceae bacterium]|nr:SH3 domain-containing protein [Lachnospiraceae bacterium]
MTKNGRNGMKHALAAALFCMVMSIGIICFADEKGTVTVASAKIRASADTSSEQLGSVAQGGTVDIVGETTGTDGKTWYEVYVDANTKGYIRADLVNKNGGSTTSNTTSANQAETTASSIEAKKGTVVTNNVRIRKGASTSHDVVATANRGMVVTVTGEANGADGNKWYQISFTYNNKEITGFIRSDLVTFDNVPADTATSEITGEETPEEQPATEEVPEETQQQEEPEQTNQSGNNSSEVTPMQVDEVPYIMPGFVPVTIKSGDVECTGYQNGSFYIFYAQKSNGEQGWYLLDQEQGTYQRYVYTASGVTTPSDSGSVGIIPLIILVVIIVILAVVVVILVLKLRESSAYEDDYEGEEDSEYPEDDLEDIEELEEEEEAEPIRRPAPQGSPQVRAQAAAHPARRPVPQGQAAAQAARRPAPQGTPMPQGTRPQQRPVTGQGAAQAVRRPAPQGANMPQSQQAAAQTVRRPAPQGTPMPQGTRPQQRPVTGQGTAPVRRPAPQGVNMPQGQQAVRRPAPQADRPQLQKGYKAKNLMEDDEDIDFMDI